MDCESKRGEQKRSGKSLKTGREARARQTGLSGLETPLRGNGTVKNSTKYPIIKTITSFPLVRQALFARIQKKSHYFLIFCIKTVKYPQAGAVCGASGYP
jgi:hypothetical protein